MKRNKRTLIISCVLFFLILMGFGTIYQVFYSSADATPILDGKSNEESDTSKTTPVINAAANLEEEPEKNLYAIYLSSKWLRIKSSGQIGYVANQYITQNTDGLTINKYSPSQFGTTTLETPLKTGPGVTYSIVVQLPLGMPVELIGEIVNPAGEKWLMYEYAYAIYYVAAKDIELNIPVPPPVTTTTAKKPTTPPPSTPPTAPPTTNGQKIVSLAYSKLGSAYVYGAVGPNSFDCSGFVYWVVNNSGIAGLSVPRTSISLYNQFAAYNIGTSIANANPGDIILFSKDGTVSGISHSAIYYKDSKMIHASEPSTGVILTTVAYSTSNKSVFAIIRLPGV